MERPEALYLNQIISPEGKPPAKSGGMAERIRSEENSALLASIVESTDDAIASVDLNSTFLSWNRGAEKLFGYPAEEVVGSHLTVLGEYDDSDEIHKFISERIENGESVRGFELCRRKKDSTLMRLSITVSPMRKSNGELMGSCVVFRDVTEERRREEKIKRLAENLVRSNKELEEYAYIASHDIREPLRTMASFGRLLEKDYYNRLDARGLEYLEFIIEASNRMRRLIDSLLDYSKLEQVPLNRQRIDCDRLVERVLSDLRVSLKETAAEIHVETLPVVLADEIQLNQLFQNLISNAIKFTGDAPPRINISAELKNGEWIFSVRDHGIGIDPQFQEKVFQLFRRGHGRGEFPGSGVGLATCKKIVERHRGRIWFSSNPAEGTTFFFSLPE